MRKNISTYNHKKFAQTSSNAKATLVRLTNPDYIKSLLLQPNLGDTFAYLSFRFVFSDNELNIKDKTEFDKKIYTKDNVDKYIKFLDVLNNKIKFTGSDKIKFGRGIAAAKELINKKYKQVTSTTPSQSPTSPGTPQVVPAGYAAQQVQITPEQANKHLGVVIPTLITLSKDKEKIRAFISRYSIEIDDILYAMNILRTDAQYYEKYNSYNKDLSELSKIYYDSMFPAGWSVAGNSVFVHDKRTVANEILKLIPEAKTKGDAFTKANEKIKIFQNEFLDKNPGNTDVAEIANKINKEIDKFNGETKDNVKVNLENMGRLTRLK